MLDHIDRHWPWFARCGMTLAEKERGIPAFVEENRLALIGYGHSEEQAARRSEQLRDNLLYEKARDMHLRRHWYPRRPQRWRP